MTDLELDKAEAELAALNAKIASDKRRLAAVQGVIELATAAGCREDEVVFDKLGWNDPPGDEPDELDGILARLKIAYLVQCGSRGGSPEGFEQYVETVRAADPALNDEMMKAWLTKLAMEVWNDPSCGLPDAGISMGDPA